MTIVRTLSVLAASALIATACQEEATSPAIPVEPVVDAAIAPDAVSTDGEACPCWSERTLAIAFADPAFFFDHRDAEGFRPALSLQTIDHEAVTILEAWVEYDAAAVDASARSCRLASVGQEGLIEELAAAGDLSEMAHEACSRSILETASASGLLESEVKVPGE